MDEILIIDAIRRPMGKRGGWLREQHLVKLRDYTSSLFNSI